jgi:hypothetical protein
MDDDQDWRLRVEIDDPGALHAKLRDARHFERELDPLVADDVVLSHDGSTLFAYASTSASIDEARRAIEHQLAADGLRATVRADQWDEASSSWLAPGEPVPARPTDPAEEPVVTRTYAETSGKLVRNWFETVVAAEARERGVALSIVEHPHLMTTQIAFTLTGPTSAVDAVIRTIRARATNLTQFESASLTPI